MSQWVHVPDGSIVYITPAPLYKSVGGPDDLTDVLDHWAETHTGSCTVIDDNPNVTRGNE